MVPAAPSQPLPSDHRQRLHEAFRKTAHPRLAFRPQTCGRPPGPRQHLTAHHQRLNGVLRAQYTLRVP